MAVAYEFISFEVCVFVYYLSYSLFVRLYHAYLLIEKLRRRNYYRKVVTYELIF